MCSGSTGLFLQLGHGPEEAFPPQTHSLWEFSFTTDEILTTSWAGCFNLSINFIDSYHHELTFLLLLFFFFEIIKAALSYRISLLAEWDANYYLIRTHLSNIFSLWNKINSVKWVSVMHRILAELPPNRLHSVDQNVTNSSFSQVLQGSVLHFPNTMKLGWEGGDRG